MKILALNWRDPLHPEAGGAEVHLDKVLSHLAKNHEVRLVSTKVSGQEFSYMRNGYLVERAGNPFFFHLSFKNQWKQHYSKFGYDLIIDDISKIGLKTPAFIKDVPILGIFHHIHGETLYSLLPYPLAWYVYHAERRSLKTYTQTPIVVVSPSTRDELTNFAPFNNLYVLPNGIDTEFFTEGAKNPLQFCYIGRITRAKGVHYSMQAFAKVLEKYPRAKFIIAGRGKESDTLHVLAQELGIRNNVEFRGYITEQEKINLYKESSLVLFTSEKEGWGITAIEASACGTPVFGFDVPGVRDSVKNSENGYLVPFADTGALAEKILWYLGNANEQKRLPKSAQNFARNFSWEKITAQFEDYMITLCRSFKNP